MATPRQFRRRGRWSLIIGTLFAALTLGTVAFASSVDEAIVDATAPTGSVALAPGASGPITINLTVTGKQDGTATFEVFRDWTLAGGTFTGSNPQTFTVNPRTAQDPATTFSTSGTVTVDGGQSPGGPFTLAVGAFDITNSNSTGAKLGAGASSSYSVTVTSPPPPSDATPPVITPQISGTLGNDGWYVGDVTVTWAVNDPDSSIASSGGCGPTTINTDTAGITLTCTATSAGGTSSQSVTIKRDATPPTITYDSRTAANGNGWNNTDVTADWTCTDALSGPVSASVSETVSTEGANQSVTGTCHDNAGNSAGDRQTGIDIDKTAPSVVYTSASPAPNGAGWNNTDVVATFTATDTLSGFAGPSQTMTGTSTASVEGSAVTVGSPAFTDLAGNTAAAGTATSDPFKIDKTKPTVSVTGVSDGATYTLGSVPAAGCSTADSLSGVQTDATLGTSGGPVGSVTLTCSGGKDNADNAASPVSVTYTVVYDWTGFFQPVDNRPTCNKAKAGSAVPVKFSLSGYQGMSIFSTGYPRSATALCAAQTADAIEETATAGNSTLSYDSISDEYVYVWKTDKSWAGTSRMLVVRLADGTYHYANFTFTK